MAETSHVGYHYYSVPLHCTAPSFPPRQPRLLKRTGTIKMKIICSIWYKDNGVHLRTSIQLGNIFPLSYHWQNVYTICMNSYCIHKVKIDTCGYGVLSAHHRLKHVKQVFRLFTAGVLNLGSKDPIGPSRGFRGSMRVR